MRCKTCGELLMYFHGRITHVDVHDASNEIYAIDGCENMVILSGEEEKNTINKEMEKYFISHPEIPNGYTNWKNFHRR